MYVQYRNLSIVNGKPIPPYAWTFGWLTARLQAFFPHSTTVESSGVTVQLFHPNDPDRPSRSALFIEHDAEQFEIATVPVGHELLAFDAVGLTVLP